MDTGTGTKNFLTKLFLLSGVLVGLTLLHNVDPAREHFPIEEEHALPTIKLMGSLRIERRHGLAAPLEGSISGVEQRVVEVRLEQYLISLELTLHIYFIF